MINKIYDKVIKYIKENKGFLLAILLIIVVFNLPLPYYIEAPGGVINIDDRITVENGYTNEGSFGMAYVSMIKGTIPSLFLSLFNKNWEVTKNADLTYEDESIKEMEKRERAYFDEAINNAKIVAFTYANKEININSQHLKVLYLDEKANTDVLLYDEILKVNGIPVKTITEVKKIINNLDKDKVDIEVLRNNKTITCFAYLYDSADGKKIGFLSNTEYDITTDPKIEISSKDNESGPSGGLIMSLAIYNKLVKEDITKGLKVIGTGTIDEDGNVGVIGGIKYKLLGAEKDHCDIFLLPVDNYEEAKKVKEEYNLNIKIVKVATFKEAIESLRSL